MVIFPYNCEFASWLDASKRSWWRKSTVFEVHLSPPAGEVRALSLPLELLPPLPYPLSPLSSQGLDCFTPSLGNRQARGRTSFPEESAGGRGRERGRGKGGGAKAVQATATASELAGRSTPGGSTVRKLGLAAARLRLRAGGAGARGSPGCCIPGLPRTCPAPPAGRPRVSTACDSGGSGTRAPPTSTYDFGVPQPERNGRPGWGSPGHGVTGRSALLDSPLLQPPVVSVPSRM